MSGIGFISCIYCSLVLQHLSENWIRKYLEDFQRMSEFLFLNTRWYTDDGFKPLIPIVFDYFLPDDSKFKISDILEQRTAPESQFHFSVLLRSRVSFGR